MVEHLSTLVENFLGAANQTRCFTHILNLIVKSILCQFEVQKKTDGNEPDDLDDAMKALAVLAQELELEESSTELIEDPEEELEEDDEVTEDDEDGLGDERNGMSEEEVAELDESLVLIQLMLTKVSPFELSQELSNTHFLIASHTCECH